jgi:uncharacterized phiE125 gp8 family phage protein
MAITLITAPEEEPVSLTEAKAHLRVDITDDDKLITNLIVAAREYVETYTRRALVTQTWELCLDAFPSEDYIELPLPPLESVTSVKYTDHEGTETTFSDYEVDVDSLVGRVVLSYGESWPVVTLKASNAIKVLYVTGYGDAEDVPQAIKQVVLFLVAHWYETREPVVVGTIAARIPITAEAILSNHRVVRYDG